MSNDKQGFKDEFGDTLLGVIIAVCFAFVLFDGDPNIAESLRVIVEGVARDYAAIKPSQ